MPKEKETREQKGQRLFKDRKVRGNKYDGFKVKGSNGNEYNVIFLDEQADEISCECVDNKMHAPQTCKHGFAAFYLFQDQLERGFYL
jgi:hypothetical protein